MEFCIEKKSWFSDPKYSHNFSVFKPPSTFSFFKKENNRWFITISSLEELIDLIQEVQYGILIDDELPIITIQDHKESDSLWILTTDRIPKHSEPVYVTILVKIKQNNDVINFTYTDRAYMEFGKDQQPKGWYAEHIDDPYNDEPLQGVIAWMETPQAYRNNLKNE